MYCLRYPFELNTSLLIPENFIFPNGNPVCVWDVLILSMRKCIHCCRGKLPFLSGCGGDIPLEAGEMGQRLAQFSVKR